MSKKNRKLCVIINPSLALTLLRKQWTYWIEQGWEVHCITGPGDDEHERVRKIGVKTFVVPMERYPSPGKDFISLLRIWWILLWNRYDVLHISTPKASFLGALAGRMSFHKRIYYLVRGRAYENMTGFKRKIMNFCERLTCGLSKMVVPICHELGDVLVNEGLCARRKIRVVAAGSSAGIDLDRFTRSPEKEEIGAQLRRDFGIAPNDLVIFFVGWLRRDKGVNELVTAFEQLSNSYPQLHLVMLGSYEPSDPLEERVQNLIDTHTRIHHIKWSKEPAPIYTVADIVAFPSYREGFGNAAMEGAAMELPVVASDIMGCRESVVNNQTGLLIPKANADALKNALERLILDPELRHQLGQAGRKRAETQFRQEIIYQGTLALFDELLAVNPI